MLPVALGIATSVGAQELEPGLYVNAPIGLNSIVVNYAFSTVLASGGHTGSTRQADMPYALAVKTQ